MKPKQFSEEQIIGILKEAEAGAVVTDLCRRHGMSGVTSINLPIVLSRSATIPIPYQLSGLHDPEYRCTKASLEFMIIFALPRHEKGRLKALAGTVCRFISLIRGKDYVMSDESYPPAAPKAFKGLVNGVLLSIAFWMGIVVIALGLCLSSPSSRRGMRHKLHAFAEHIVHHHGDDRAVQGVA